MDTQLHKMPGDIVQSTEESKSYQDSENDKGLEAMDSKTEKNNNRNNSKPKSKRPSLRDQLLQGSESSSMQSPATQNVKSRDGEKFGQDRELREEQEKRTRSQRKRKYQENFSYYIDESDAQDLSGDSSSQEYKPSEDEESDSTKKRKKMSVSKTNILTPKGKAGNNQKPVMRKPKKTKVTTLHNSSSTNTLDMPDIFNEHMRSPPAKISRKKKTTKIPVKRKKAVSDREDSEAANDSVEDDESRVTNNGKNSAVKFSNKNSRYGQPYSITGSWYIASGYLEDLLELLQHFENVKSWRFSTFSSCWREMKFSLIYRGRQSFKELLEFSEEVADITKRFLSPTHSMKMRVGALYTLYGLYYKHPIRHFFKIRIVKDEYYHLLELVEPFRCKAENPDPAILFRTLETDGAFYHTATTQEMCLDFHSAEREEVGLKYELQRIVTTSAVSLTMPMDVLDTDEALMQHYDKLKTAVLNTKSPGKALSMVDKSVTSEVKNAVLKLNEDLLVAVGIKNPFESTNEAQQTSWLSDIGRRRSEVRNKAVSSSTADVYVKTRGLLAKEKCNSNLILRGGKIQHLKGCRTQTNNPTEEGITDNESDVDKTPTSSNNKKASRASRNVIGQILTDKKIRNYMKPPSAEVTNIPLRSMGTIKAVPKARKKGYKHTLSDEEDADDPLKMSEGESSCDKDISIPEHKNFSGGTNNPLKVPKSEKRYKRRGKTGKPRGRPRKVPLPQNPFPAKAVDVIQSDSDNQIVTPDTSVAMPLKTEEQQDDQRNEIKDDHNKFMILNVQICSDNINNQSKKLKILKSDWKAISEDEKKLFELKRKLLGLMLPGREITDNNVRDIYTKMTVTESSVENRNSSSCTVNAMEQTPELMSESMTSKSPPNKKGQSNTQGNTVTGVLLMPVKVGGVTRLIPVPSSAIKQNKARMSMPKPDTKNSLVSVPCCTTSPDFVSSDLEKNYVQIATQTNGDQVTNTSLPGDELDSVMKLGPQLPELDSLNLDPLFLEKLPIRKREVLCQQVTTDTSPIKQDIQGHDNKENTRATYTAGTIAYSAMDSLVNDEVWNSDENSDLQGDSDFQTEDPLYLSKNEVTNNNSPLSSDNVYTSPKSQRDTLTSTNSLESIKLLPRVIHSSDPWLNNPSAEVPALPILQTLNTREQGQTSRYPVQVPPLSIPLQAVMQHPDSNLVHLPQHVTIMSDSTPFALEMPPIVPVQEIATSNAFVPSQATSDCVTLLAQGVPSSSFTSQHVVSPQGSAQSCNSPVNHILRPSTSGHHAEVQHNLNMRCVPLLYESQYITRNGTPSKVSEVPKILNIAMETTPYSERLTNTKDIEQNMDVGDEKKMGGNIHSPNQLQTPRQISRAIPFTSPKEVTRERELPGEVSNHGSNKLPKQTTDNCQWERQGAWSSPVCTFLYSPKYKALSKLKGAGGIATGTPVQLKEKPRVPFILKHSLVQKRKK